MFVVLARDSAGETSVYGVFSRKPLAEEWAQLQIVRDVELTVLPILNPREDRRRGQMVSDQLDPDVLDTVAKAWGS